MKIEVNESGRLELSEINTIITLKASEENELKLTVRDGGFEILYGDNRYTSEGTELIKI